MDRKEQMPHWVYFGLLNIETRKGALILFWSCFILAFAFIPLSIHLEDWSWAGMMFAVSAWYWLCLRWVDRNAAWD